MTSILLLKATCYFNTISLFYNYFTPQCIDFSIDHAKTQIKSNDSFKMKLSKQKENLTVKYLLRTEAKC